MPHGFLTHRLRRPEARGKYLFVGNEKLWVRGVTYGTFRPDAQGNEYGRWDQVERDLATIAANRSEEHTSELQSLRHLVCRLLLEKKKRKNRKHHLTDE